MYDKKSSIFSIPAYFVHSLFDVPLVGRATPRKALTQKENLHLMKAHAELGELSLLGLSLALSRSLSS